MNLVENILDKHNPDFFLCQGCQNYLIKRTGQLHTELNSSKKYVYYSENSTLTTTRVVASLNNK